MRKQRTGRPNPLTRHLMPRKRAPLPVSVQRASERMAAREEHPELTSWLEKCDADFRAAKAAGRFEFQRVLFKVFKRVQEWKEKGQLDVEIRIVAQIGGFHLRQDANPFYVVLRACGKRSPKTVSRWAGLLEAASKKNVEGMGFQIFLNKRKAERQSSLRA